MVDGGMNRPPYQKDKGIAELFAKAQTIYREMGKELLDVPLTGGGSDGNFTAALGIPTLDGLGADGKGAHASTNRSTISRCSHDLPLHPSARDARLTDRTILHSQNARSLRVLWVLEEMEVKAEVKSLPFPPRKLQPEYLALNPSGTVPLMIDGERLMTKSLAIANTSLASMATPTWSCRRTIRNGRPTCNGCGTATPPSCCRWA